jgi:hypothetical protein
MRKITTFVVISLFLGLSVTFAQKKAKQFTGTLTFSITYDGTWDAATLSMQPKEFTVLINETQSKTEYLMQGVSLVTITNAADSSTLILVNAMGQKMYSKMTKEAAMESIGEKAEPKINYIDETKTVSGFECKKAEYITLDEYDEEFTTVVWYTTLIGTPAMNFAQQFDGLAGYPMEYIVETEEGKIIYSATEAKKAKVKDTEFMIPSDFQEISWDEFKGMLGG